MKITELYDHQKQALKETRDKTRVAYYHDMGLGKTYTGGEKMVELNAKVNLVICQKSKIEDWINHFKENYPEYMVYDLTKPKELINFLHGSADLKIGMINYELAWRRKELAKLQNFTLMLDESSLIQNENAKRSRFILKLQAANVILLSGTPTGGKYENLWSQMHLLGWEISKKLYWRQYIDTEVLDNEGYPITIVKGYKNVDRLKRKMREHGCNFLKTEEVINLPDQIDQKIKIDVTKEYGKFRRDNIVIIDGVELVGDNTLTKMLYERQLCGHFNPDKLQAFEDLAESTNDRLIVFYNFNAELEALKLILTSLKRPYSLLNGSDKDLSAYDEKSNSVSLVQYQAGAMGVNLQKANKIVYFTPPLSSELFEQSKKRIHRIGQERTCFYYYLICKNSVEEKIYKTLAMRKDYTEKLFEEDSHDL